MFHSTRIRFIFRISQCLKYKCVSLPQGLLEKCTFYICILGMGKVCKFSFLSFSLLFHSSYSCKCRSSHVCRRIRDEIGSLQTNGRVQRDIQANTDRYLSLALPPSHNEGQSLHTVLGYCWTLRAPSVTAALRSLFI